MQSVAYVQKIYELIILKPKMSYDLTPMLPDDLYYIDDPPQLTLGLKPVVGYTYTWDPVVTPAPALPAGDTRFDILYDLYKTPGDPYSRPSWITNYN